MYPSFLGPHASRNRVTVKSSKSLKHEASARSPARAASMPASSDTDSMRPIGLPVPELNRKPKVKPLPVQVLGPLSSQPPLPSSAARSVAPKPGRFRSSEILFLLTFTCIASLSWAIGLQTKVAKLQEENINLHRWCNHGDVHTDGIQVLEPQNESSLFSSGVTGSRTIALYTVLLSLIMLFASYKYLDYVPRVKNLSERTKDRFGGLALYAVTDSSFTEALWQSWTFVADSGNHADIVGSRPRIVSVSISSGGMLIFAMMLGLVSDAISEKVDSLRKGKSEVIESNHILILGWSDKLGSLLKQLAIANKSLGGGVVVVLAERDKEEMEMDIAKLEFDFMGTSVICRSGSPLILADLKKVSVSKARAIIVLASDENADQSDARALRVVLSLTGVKEGLRGHVVVEMSDLDNEPLVKLVGGELVETVVAHDVIGRLMIQCALQPGLAQKQVCRRKLSRKGLPKKHWQPEKERNKVAERADKVVGGGAECPRGYGRIFWGFENAEFYIKRWPQLNGLCFKNVLISFADAIPCGVKVAADGGKIIINPDDNYVLKEGDEILVIAEDDDTYAPGPITKVCKGVFPKMHDPPKYPEKILFCGWRRDIDDMIYVLEAFLAPGSELWMFNEVPERERERKLTDGGLDILGLVNIKNCPS
ncbi:hypothetical protein Acr_10g0000870 [Actinidia rufa]|uniref:RCK N-terminal domain-containing protein n=1 Tax=Actinidia rufa TaxID=165716 RepID=A0A7J0F7K9_9ERIC|nr:hypothetical protein Acr_10g0000870 [Actinidia rufa]